MEVLDAVYPREMRLRQKYAEIGSRQDEFLCGVQFTDFVRAEAWRDAAAMLMPDKWRVYQVSDQLDVGWLVEMVHVPWGEPPPKNASLAKGCATGPHAEARARLAAALRARAAASEGV